MRTRSKVALSCLVVLVLLVLAAAVGLLLLWNSLDDPIPGWQEQPSTRTTHWPSAGSGQGQGQ